MRSGLPLPAAGTAVTGFAIAARRVTQQHARQALSQTALADSRRSADQQPVGHAMIMVGTGYLLPQLSMPRQCECVCRHRHTHSNGDSAALIRVKTISGDCEASRMT